MKVLAKKANGELMTFDNMLLFNTAKKEFFPDMEIIETNYTTKDDNVSIDDIPIEIIEPEPELEIEQNNLLDITVKEFYAKQYTFTDDEMRVLADHSSQTISKNAKKRLRKKS